MDIATERRRCQAGINRLFQKFQSRLCVINDSSCSEKVIAAHTVQNKRVLDVLANDDGEVIMVQPELDEPARFALVGQNQATTFTGFCSHHDSTIFKPIDFSPQSGFTPKNKEQEVLFMFRALAMEYWKKKAVEATLKELLSHIDGQRYTELQTILNDSAEGVRRLCALRDDFWEPLYLGTSKGRVEMEQLLGSARYQISNRKFGLTITQCFSIPGKGNIATSSGFSPDYDLKGNRLTDWARLPVPHIALTILPLADETQVLFSFHRKFRHLLDDFFCQVRNLTTTEREIFISKTLTLHCENLVIAPRFLERLSAQQKSSFLSEFAGTIIGDKDYSKVSPLNFFASP